ncbi:VRR-NUC domain-containing protein [Photobacterium sanctipauli]|uniref:phosphodiesterase I n=2 Tax=Photobacterium sanctipauli TaxID=1342794 RepID=A0A2T3NNY4_9GAMM|nr:VRR-NUC domain-containing protein [Photobacterium sanctipauli]PSW17625.1 VRR-NUC domain-containing protein [Photobacterium sanctipauli]
MISPTELSDDYYQTNFVTLINTVSSQYEDLLSADEKHWLATFRSLSSDAQKLYIRLLTRKGPLFRLSKLSYREIADLNSAANELNQCGLAHLARPDSQHSTQPNASIEIALIAALFTKPELLALFEPLSSYKQQKKAIIVEALQQLSPTLGDFKESIIEVKYSAHLNVFLLLFFGNSRQDLTEFVLSDLGVQCYESYTIDRQHRLFSSRDDIEQWLSLAQLKDQYWQAKEQKDAEAIAELACHLPSPYQWPLLEKKRQQLVNLIARDIERIGQTQQDKLDEALTLFEQSELPPARERRTRILDKQGQVEQAYQLALAMQQAPKSEEEADVADVLVRKLARKLAIKSAPAKKPVFSSYSLTLPNNGDRVEHCVANHYEHQGWHAYYLENTLICGLFGLAFWDIIFNDGIQGAFLNPFQRSPKDMFSSAFYQQRQTAIDDRLLEIATGKWQQWLTVYQQKQGISNDWVHWPLITPEVIKHATNHFPPTALDKIFRRILFDPKNNRSGFPDLILFKEDEFRWIEVKGPGDKLQSNQIRWLKVFQQLALPAEVVYVAWDEAL